MALRIPLEWQALSGDLQDLEGAGSQESRIAGARAVTPKKAQSGHITGHEVSKQWLEAKRSTGIPGSVRGRVSL